MTELFLTLTTERKAELMDACAAHHATLEALEAKKDREMKIINGEIKAEEEAINSILRVVRGKGENKDQRELFAGEGRVTEDAAQQALAALKARRPECSPINSRECPVHGTCTCERLEDEVEGEGPAVKSLDCPLHMIDAPHITEPAQAEPELTEPQIVEAMAKECVEEWARLGKTPESVKDRNARVKEAIGARSIPTHRRKPFGEAVKRLLSDQPTIPAGAGASDEPPVEEPGDADGNVAEAEA